MRQEYIHEMTYPRLRREYVEADAADTWAPKSTRRFEHSEDITAAWTALNSAVRENLPYDSERAADEAIGKHLTAILPVPGDSGYKYILVNEREVGFGPDWTAEEIADLVASDVIPDTRLMALIDTARNDPATLSHIQESARAHYERQMEAEAAYDEATSYEPDEIAQVFPHTLSFPSHPAEALRPPAAPASTNPAAPSSPHRTANLEL